MALVDGYDSTVYALLDIPLPDDRELAPVGALWIETACRGLAPRWWERLRDSIPLGERGEPGGVYAYTSITTRPWDGQVETEPLSQPAWDRAVEALGTRPLNVTVQLRELDDQGERFAEGGGGLRISVRSLEDHPERAQLEAIGRVPGEEGDLGRPLPGRREAWKGRDGWPPSTWRSAKRSRPVSTNMRRRSSAAKCGSSGGIRQLPAHPGVGGCDGEVEIHGRLRW